MSPHVPKPPLDTLTGEWTIVTARKGAISSVQTGGRRHRFQMWGLVLRHVETDTVAEATYRARLETEFRTGQRLDGYIKETWDADVFRRGTPRAKSGRRG